MVELISENYILDKFFGHKILGLTEDQFLNYNGEDEPFQPTSDLDDMNDVLQRLRQEHPQITTSFSFGESDECEFSIREELASDFVVTYKATDKIPEEASARAVLKFIGIDSIEDIKNDEKMNDFINFS